MKLGLLTAPFAATPLAEVADWANAAGFEALEIACWPKTSGATRRYAGTSHIDAASTSPAQAKEIVATLTEKKLTVSGLGYYPNPLHPDAAHREAVISHLKKVIALAANMGVPVVNTFCGGDAAKTVDVNWQDALKVWPEIVAFARGHGIKLAFENCPMIFSNDEWPGGHNIAYSPHIWRRMFEAWGDRMHHAGFTAVTYRSRRSAFTWRRAMSPTASWNPPGFARSRQVAPQVPPGASGLIGGGGGGTRL